MNLKNRLTNTTASSNELLSWKNTTSILINASPAWKARLRNENIVELKGNIEEVKKLVDRNLRG